MRPTWLVEAGVYGAEAEPLLAEVRRQGIVAEVMTFTSLLKDTDLTAGGRPLSDGDCVIGYGTFPFARQIQLHRRWVPGAWCDPANLDGEVIARPSGCNKVFTGRCVYKDDFSSALGPTRYDPATLVVIAPSREIDREWRLVVAGDKVVASSRYAVCGKKDLEQESPQEVRAFAEAMLGEVRWRPDPIFMMDVCESEGRLWLVELNGFSTSWLYACDLAAVVAEVSDLAAATWERGRQ